MKDNINLFIVSDDDTLEINKIEVRATPEYKAILTRDRGSEGDADGRKKLIAFKELMFMWCFVHPASTFRDLPDKERYEKAKGFAGLPDEWEADETVNNACKRFKKDLELSALHYSYVNANRGVYGVGQDLAFFNGRRERLRKSVEKNTLLLEKAIKEDEQIELYKKIEYDTNSLLDIGNKIMAITNNLPTAYKTIEELRKKLSEESNNSKEIYGGGKLGNREK